MTTCRVAVPVKLARLRVRIDKGRNWTEVDRLVLWALASRPRTSQALARELDVPARLINEIVLNLMHAGWVELAATPGGLSFRATEFGEEAFREFEALPSILTEVSRPLSFLVEPFQLRAYTLRDLKYYRRAEIDNIAAERDVRRVVIQGDQNWGLNAMRLHDAADGILAEAGRGETLSSIDIMASHLSTEYVLFTVTDGHIRGLPPAAPKELINEIRRAAKSGPRGQSTQARPVRLAEQRGPVRETVSVPEIDTTKILVAGADHRDAIKNVLRNARYHVIIHSTFLRTQAFIDLEDEMRGAAKRGARIDILWGSAKGERETDSTYESAIEINRRCQEDLNLRKRAVVHMRSTRSHAKLLIADTGRPDSYIALVGSCNWLSTGFKRLEMSMVFDHPAVVAGLALELAELIFASYPSSNVAATLNGIARELRKLPAPEGPARVRIVCGDTHGEIIRTARESAARRIMVGADRLSVAAEARTLIPLIRAAERNVRCTILYSRRNRPLSQSDEKALKREAEAAGVTMVEMPENDLHGKFLLWDDDEIVVSSLNWPSADTSADLPQGEIGVHITSPGIAEWTVKYLEQACPAAFRNSGPWRHRSE